MKRRTAIISIALSLVLILGTFQAAFAGYGIKGTAPDGNEYNIEKAALKLIDDAAASGYGVIGTDEMEGMLSDDILIIDTMSVDSYNAHHVPGAINIECGDNTDANGPWDEEDQGGALLKAAHQKYGTVAKTYYWSSYSKKWLSKKPKAKYWKKCTRKGDRRYGYKTKVINKWVKDQPIVVYCGFVKCRRSHFAADYLVRQGYTKVSRYAGGISAWGDQHPDE